MTRSTRTRWLTGMWVAAALLLVAAACGSDDSSPEPRAEPAPSEEVEFAGTIEFGVNFEITGPLAPVGLAALDGVELAVEDINAAGGIVIDGKHYEVAAVVRDNENDPALASTNAVELVRDRGVKFIFGPSGTATTQAQLPVTGPAKVLTFTNDPTIESSLTEQPIPAPYDYVIKYSELASRFLTNVFDNIGEIYDGETIALLMGDDATGEALTKAVQQVIEETESLELVDVVRFPAGTQDFSPFLTEIAAKDVDIIYQCCDVAANVIVGQQIAELDAADAYWGVAFAESTYSDIVEALGSVPRQAYISGTSSPTISRTVEDPRRATFAKHIEETLGREAQANAFITGQLYQVTRNLAEAIEVAGTADDVDAVKQALLGLVRDDVAGDAYVTSSHFLAMPQELVLYQDGGVAEWALLPALESE